MSSSDLTSSAKAYVDDLTLVARSPESCQQLINIVNNFLNWTRTTKAKPSKCRSHAMKKVIPNAEQTLNGHKTQYVAYNPQLQIDGQMITYINNQPMRFLGKLIYEDLKDDGIRQMINQKLSAMLKTTDKSQLNGIKKMWIYNHMIIPKIT
ncbi:uncharacterized protein [Amphiura filiformis]|uniref:uncharacterized protein n=1 Tax=Amphiura filiformis TaxID=82378 RepID=UPI003B224221